MHVGKGYPRTMINTVWFAESTVRDPPRKLSFVGNPLGYSGSVAALWAGTTTVSGLAYRHAVDPLKTSWDFENATDPLATLTFSAWITEFVPLPTGGAVYYWRYFIEAFYNGAHLADYENGFDLDPGFSPFHPHIFPGPTWNHRVNNALWLNLYSQCHSATWAQQPEYHPYRH